MIVDFTAPRARVVRGAFAFFSLLRSVQTGRTQVSKTETWGTLTILGREDKTQPASLSLRKRREEFRADTELALQRSGLALAFGLDGNEASYWFGSSGDNDFLALGGFLD